MFARPHRPPLSTWLVRLMAALTAALAAGEISCSSSQSQPGDGGSAASCVSAPACADAGAPSYRTVVLPILQQDCIPCHSPSGTAGYDESTYAQVATQAGAMLSQVATCGMPPLNGPQLDDAQRIALTAWLKCSAPNN